MDLEANVNRHCLAKIVEFLDKQLRAAGELSSLVGESNSRPVEFALSPFDRGLTLAISSGRRGSWFANDPG